jgi:hypothetical protein
MLLYSCSLEASPTQVSLRWPFVVFQYNEFAQTQSTSHVTELNELVKLCTRGSILSPPILPLFSLISMQ